jgi:hypothetical protein
MTVRETAACRLGHPRGVKRKLIVDTNKRMESRLPAIDSLGASGLMASRIAAVVLPRPTELRTYTGRKL